MRHRRIPCYSRHPRLRFEECKPRSLPLATSTWQEFKILQLVDSHHFSTTVYSTSLLQNICTSIIYLGTEHPKSRCPQPGDRTFRLKGLAAAPSIELSKGKGSSADYKDGNLGAKASRNIGSYVDRSLRLAFVEPDDGTTTRNQCTRSALTSGSGPIFRFTLSR